jgi:hypothetical protein
MATESPPRSKSPGRIASGYRTAEKRWGEYPHRVVRLADLDTTTREVIVSILRARRNADAAQQNAKAAPASETPEAAQEDRRVGVDHPSAA